MAITSGYRYITLAGIAAVVAVTLVFAIYNDSGLPESPAGEQVTNQSRKIGEPSDGSLASAVSGEHSLKSDYSRSGQETHEYGSRVSIDVSSTGVLVVAVEAGLNEVLDGLVDKALVEVVDLRPEEEAVIEADQHEQRSFRFSGSVDDVLHYVMGQYNHSYVISHSPDNSTQARPVLAKLFLYGPVQGENPGFGDEQYIPSATAEAVPAPGSRGNGLEGDEKKRVSISEVLRKRALSSANQPAPSASSGTSQKYTYSGGASSVGADPVSGTYEDEATQARLAEMTRRASQEVQALVEGLRAAEKSLKAQSDNQYGETGP